MDWGDGYGGTSEDLPVRGRCLVCFGISGVRNPDSRLPSKLQSKVLRTEYGAQYVARFLLYSMSTIREGTLHPSLQVEERVICWSLSIHFAGLGKYCLRCLT